MDGKAVYMKPESQWEYYSFKGELRDSLNGEIFDTIEESKVIREMWRKHYNNTRLHSSLDFFYIINLYKTVWATVK